MAHAAQKRRRAGYRLPRAFQSTDAERSTLNVQVGRQERRSVKHVGVRRWALGVFQAFLLGAFSLLAADPLIVTFETPSFALDTRLTGSSGNEAALVVSAVSSAFSLDTRLNSGTGDGSLVVQAESAVFTLDTQLAMEGVTTGLRIVKESASFTLDTRLLSAGGASGGLLLAAESPVFTLDTRLSDNGGGQENLVLTVESTTFTLDTRMPDSNPSLALLVKQAESDVFPLDTRLPSQNPIYANLTVTAEYGPFTIDTLSGWNKTVSQTLTGGTTGGKARFAPDGLRLAKADGSRVLLWNLHSAKSNTVFSGHSGEVVSLAFSPLGDQLLTGGADGTVRQWDTASRSQLSLTNPSGGGAAYVAFASDGARVLTGRGMSVSLYRAPDMQIIQGFSGMDGTAEAVALCPEGLALAGSSTREALLWDTTTGALLLRFSNHTHLVTACAFYPGGGKALTASLDGTVRVWDTTDGMERLRIDQRSPVADAALSADGELLATCDTGTPGTAYLWDAQTGDMVRVFTDTGSEASAIKGVALSPDHTLLATTHADGRVRLWDTGLPPRPAQTIIPLGMATNVPVTLRSHGLYYFEVDAEAGRSLVVTLEAAPAPAPAASVRGLLALSAASPAGQAISSDAEFANLGAGTDMSTGRFGGLQLMGFRPAPAFADVTAFRMTAKKGKLPSEYDYETFTQASTTDLHCEMPLATATTNKMYVLVFAPYLSAGSIQARIRTEYADFHLSSVVPARGGGGGNVTARLQGTGFTQDTTARLVGPGGATATSQLALWGDSTKAWFTFALSNAPTGSYQVEISKPGATAAVLAGNFQVVNAVGPQLQSSLTAPSAVRPGRDYGMTLTYANVGDTDMAAPLFTVSSADQRPSIYSLPKIVDLVWTQAGGAPSTPRVAQLQLLGLSQDGPPGVLPPGASYEIPLYFQGDGSAVNFNMTFNLSVLKADATPIDWTALEAKLRPADMAPDLWAAVWANFKSTVGGTWADYLHALDNQAHSLALSGQPSYDAGDMLGALFSQALGSPYRRSLAAAVDAQAQSPALPLQFSRFATDGLEQRFSVGPLGRGWSHSFEYEMTRPTNGVIVVRTPGGGARRYTLGAGNVWQAGAGDFARLAATAGGGFALLEKEGVLWQFDANGQLLSIEEPNHNRITLTYSGGRLTGLSHSAGPSFALAYNGQGRLVSLTDHTGQVTTYDYDATGEHLTSVTAPGAVRTVYAYRPVTGTPADHALASVTFADNTHQYFGWDAQGRMAEQSRDGGAERLQFAYDASGRVTVRDAQNAVTTLLLGPSGQLLQMTDALGRPATFNYDTNANLTRLTGPAGETTEMGYDTQGNANSIVNPLGQQVALGHAALGRLGNLTDARGQLTDFSYDAQGNLTDITYADASAETFGYDGAGAVTTWRNRRGQTVQFARNAQGKVTRKTYPDGRTIDYGYDNRGQLTNVTDSVQGVTALTYDARGLLTSITYPDGKGFSFEYNATGRRSRRVGHDGYVLAYGYDAAGRLETLTDGTGRELVRYAYDAVGRLVREDKGNGTYTLYTYDAAGQVLSVTNHAPGGGVQSFFTYTYDSKGNRISMTTASGVTAYGYDALNQLTGVTYPGGRRVTYAYDAAGNRTTVKDNGAATTYTANNMNQYTAAGGATFGYDNDGNMTRRTDAAGTTSYDYDAENRLVHVATPTGGDYRYTYDSLGNRTVMTHDGVPSRYLYDPAEFGGVAAEYDDAGTRVASYDYALGIVARSDATGTTAFYSFDALGNTRELSGNDGEVQNSYDYDAFGRVTLSSEAIPNDYKFGGRAGVSADDTGVLFKLARSYDPINGRTLSPQPVGMAGSQNCLNQYSRNDSVELLKAFEDGMVTTLQQASGIVGVFESLTDPLGMFKGVYSLVTGLENQFLFVDGVKSSGGMGADMGALLSDNPMGTNLGKSFDYMSDWWLELKSPAKGISRSLTILSYLFDIKNNVMVAIGDFLPKAQTSSVNSSVVRPRDPNDKIGPAGVGPDRIVSVADEMEYLIRFENFATASAPVQELIVVDYLDAGLDWSTVRFKEMAYGGRIITPAAGSQTFTIRDTPPANSPAVTGIGAAKMVINAYGSVNPQMGRVEWRISALDTNTWFYPLDALTGFLPPENGTGCGQGYVKFGVRPKADLPNNTVVSNIATIVFDGNDPIDTPAVWNTVGDIPSLVTTIAYLPGQIMVGMPFSYTVSLENISTNLVGNIVLTNAIPAGFAFVSATGTVGTVTYTNGAVLWAIGGLADRASALLTVTLIPAQGGEFTLLITGSGGGENFDNHPVVNVQTNPDADGDGIPDAWELAVFGNTTTAGVVTDFDRDGATDYDEWVAGTDPKNPADYLAIRQFSVTGSGGEALSAVIGWNSASNRVYDLYRSPAGVTNLTAVVTNILATPPMNVITNQAPAAMSLLYRIGVREP